jgi:hypothetical protein
MARTLRDKLAAIDPARRTVIEAEADRLHTEYLTLQELRKAKEMTQVQLAAALGVQQATVAKYERQSDLLLSTLEFPGKAPVALEGFGDAEETRRSPRVAGHSGKPEART